MALLKEAAVKRLGELFREGKTADEVCEILAAEGLADIKPWRARAEAIGLRIEFRRGPKRGRQGVRRSPNWARVHELRALGMSQKAIAAELDISPQAVSQFLSDDKERK